MKKVLVALIFLIITQTAFSESEQATETSLPLKFDTGNAAPYGMASTIIQIDGKPFPIIVDTGAKKYGLALTQEALKNLTVHFTGKMICSNSTTGEHCEKEFIIPEVRLGDFSVKNVEGILVTHFWGNNNSSGFHATQASRNGLMGYALLSKFNILLDYKNSNLTLIKPHYTIKEYDLTKWNAIPFDEHLHTRLIVDGKKLTFSWDTGAIPSVISRKSASAFKLEKCPANNPYKESLDICRRVKTTSLTTINHENISNTWLSVSDIPENAPFDGLIGSNFYDQNLVYFDFDKHEIYVRPA